MLLRLRKNEIAASTILLLCILSHCIVAERNTDNKNVVGPGVIFQQKHKAIFVDNNYVQELWINYTTVFHHLSAWSNSITNIKNLLTKYPYKSNTSQKNLSLIASTAKEILDSLHKFFDIYQDVLIDGERPKNPVYVSHDMRSFDHITISSILAVTNKVELLISLNNTDKNASLYNIMDILNTCESISYYINSRIENIKNDVNIMLASSRLSPNIISKKQFFTFLVDHSPKRKNSVILLNYHNMKYYYDMCKVIEVLYSNNYLHIRLSIPKCAFSSESTSFYIYQIIPIPMLLSDNMAIIFYADYHNHGRDNYLAVSSNRRIFVEINDFDNCVMTTYNGYHFCNVERPFFNWRSGGVDGNSAKAQSKNCLVAAFLHDRNTLASCASSSSFVRLEIPFDASFVKLKNSSLWFYSVSRHIGVKQLCTENDSAYHHTVVKQVQRGKIILEPGIGTFSFDSGCSGISDDDRHMFEKNHATDGIFVVKRYNISNTNPPPFPIIYPSFFTFTSIIVIFIIIMSIVFMFCFIHIIIIRRLNMKIEMFRMRLEAMKVRTYLNTQGDANVQTYAPSHTNIGDYENNKDIIDSRTRGLLESRSDVGCPSTTPVAESHYMEMSGFSDLYHEISPLTHLPITNVKRAPPTPPSIISLPLLPSTSASRHQYCHTRLPAQQCTPSSV